MFIRKILQNINRSKIQKALFKSFHKAFLKSSLKLLLKLSPKNLRYKCLNDYNLIFIRKHPLKLIALTSEQKTSQNWWKSMKWEDLVVERKELTISVYIIQNIAKDFPLAFKKQTTNGGTKRDLWWCLVLFYFICSQILALTSHMHYTHSFLTH